MRLVDATGATVANYKYDPYGKLLSVTDANGIAITGATHIANLNPLRYRGYYYDTETGWYYLQSRYYDPILKRFLNADTYASTGQGFLGYNMFAYCGNNPVNASDPSGSKSIIEHDFGGGVTGYTDTGTGNAATVESTSIVSSIAGVTPQEHAANRRPNTGEPNSTYEAPNGDKRYYDEDGKPIIDYDHDDHNKPQNHPHDETGGHWHTWKNGVRSTEPTPNPPTGAGMILGGCFLLALIIADDITVVGAADDVYADQVIIWIEQGWQALFG